MASAAMDADEKLIFDELVLSSINDLKKNRKRADISSVHKEVIKTIEFNDITKEYLRERIDTLILDKKIINKLNRNLDFIFC